MYQMAVNFHEECAFRRSGRRERPVVPTAFNSHPHPPTAPVLCPKLERPSLKSPLAYRIIARIMLTEVNAAFAGAMFMTFFARSNLSMAVFEAELEFP